MKQSRAAARRTVRGLVRPMFAAPLPPRLQRLLTAAATAGPVLPDGVRRDPGLLGARPAEILTPPTHERSVLYLHGGAFMLGGPATHRAFAAHLAAFLPARVYVLDYRLAPEHPYPAALDDVLDGYDDLLARGVDPATLAVCGDSAGGWLALAAALALRDRGQPLPAALGLVSPWVDLRVAPADWDADAMLSRQWLERSAQMYLGGVDPGDPRVDLVGADLRGLPPTTVHVGDEEALRGEVTALAERLPAAGVDTRFDVLPGLWHVAHTMAGSVDEATAAARAFAGSLFRAG